MEKVSRKELERLGERLKAQKGECILMANDGESDGTLCSIYCHDKDSAMTMFVHFFQSNPELISVCQMALAIAMECDMDCDDCQLCDYDDGEEEDDDGDEFCLN